MWLESQACPLQEEDWKIHHTWIWRPPRYQHRRLTQETTQTDHHVGKHNRHALWDSKRVFVLHSSMNHLLRITRHLRKALNLKDRNWNKKINKRKFQRNTDDGGGPSKAIDILIFSKRLKKKCHHEIRTDNKTQRGG